MQNETKKRVSYKKTCYLWYRPIIIKWNHFVSENESNITRKDNSNTINESSAK